MTYSQTINSNPIGDVGALQFSFFPLVGKLAELQRAGRAEDLKRVAISRRELENELVMSRQFFDLCLADWRASLAEFDRHRTPESMQRLLDEIDHLTDASALVEYVSRALDRFPAPVEADWEYGAAAETRGTFVDCIA